MKIGTALVFAFGCGISLGIGIAAIADRSWVAEKNVAASAVPEAKPVSGSKPKEQPVYSVPVRVRRLPSTKSPQATAPDVAKALPRAVEIPAASVPAEPSMAQTPEPAGGPATDATESQRAKRDTIKAPETGHADGALASLAAETGGGSRADNATTNHVHRTPLVSVTLPPQSTGDAPQLSTLPPDAVASPHGTESGPTDDLLPSGLLGHAAPDAARADAPDPRQGDRNVAGVDPSAGASIETAAPDAFVIASLPPPSEALWIRNAVATPPTSGDAMIAIIIDDMGIDQKRSRRAIEMAAPLTLSFIPYGYHLRELTDKARAAGHEVMLHLPMEPLDPEANPGPNALLTKLTPKEILRRLRWGLDRFGGYVGVNNHMGSKFTAWRPGMKLVMNEIRSRGLMFLDSWTNNRSVGLSLSKEFKVPSASRDIFIDHDVSQVAIKHSLAELEYIARRRGFAVGIGHPHDLTLELLARWVSDARSRGIDFVPISAIVRRSMKSG